MITKQIRVEYYLWEQAINKAGWKGNINQIINELLRQWVLGQIELK